MCVITYLVKLLWPTFLIPFLPEGTVSRREMLYHHHEQKDGFKCTKRNSSKDLHEENKAITKFLK